MTTSTKQSVRSLAIFLSISLPLFLSGASAIRSAGLSSHGIDVTLPSDIPEALAIPEANHLLGAFVGMGYQEYTYSGSEWLNSNVTSYLLNKKGEKIGHHQFVSLSFNLSARPNWISYHNFSYTTGEVIAVVPQASAVPLVLLKAVYAAGDPVYFGRTAYVQRLRTSEGLPPDANASMNATSGEVFKSRYSALYVFYRTLKFDVDDVLDNAPTPAPMSGRSW